MVGISLPVELIDDISTGRVNLFLGAGASYGSSQANGDEIPQSDKLISIMSKKFGENFEEDDRLPEVVGYLSTKHQEQQIDDLFREIYLKTKPSSDLVDLFQIYWPKIYTTNIDDAITTALTKNGATYQKFVMRDAIVDFQLPERRTQVVYLHGYSAELEKGIVFSRKDYINTQIDITPWYDQLANDLFFSKFIYCGTKLDEPVFDYLLEKKKRNFSGEHHSGYLVAPSLSVAKAALLESNGITHIPGTLADLVHWLKGVFPTSPTAQSVLEARYPELFSLSQQTKKDVSSVLGRLKDVVVVSELKKSSTSQTAFAVREFYRGAKPNWDELLDEVPAQLSHYEGVNSGIDSLVGDKNRALVVLGPAGSGKTTALKVAALKLAKRTDISTFFLDTSFPDFEQTIKAISEVTTKQSIVFFDGVDSISRDLSRIIENKLYENVKFVLSERRNIWNERTSSQVRSGYRIFVIDKITVTDAEAIRDKLEKFGPFSKLARLSKADQVAKIVDRSQRQLLIGMLEATSERGFEEIIRSDFRGIGSDELRFLVLVVALATIHRMGVPTHLVFSAFASRFGTHPKSHHFQSLAGIIVMDRNELIARHPLYSQILLEQIVSEDQVAEALEHLLLAFAKYGTPVPVRSRALAPLFIRLVRHRFVSAVLRGRKTEVIGLYERIEKAFAADGHFYLQFGLAYRSFGDDEEAMSRIKTSSSIYSSYNARHALAKQKIIMACKINSKIIAEPLFASAKAELQALEKEDRGAGMYPLVTLAEGEIDFVSIFDGRDKAAVIAEKYFDQINRKLSKDPGNERLKLCRDKIKFFQKEGKISILEPDDVV